MSKRDQINRFRGTRAAARNCELSEWRQRALSAEAKTAELERNLACCEGQLVARMNADDSHRVDALSAVGYYARWAEQYRPPAKRRG